MPSEMAPDTKAARGLASFERRAYAVNGVETIVYSAGQGPALVYLHGAGTFTGFEAATPWTSRFKVYIPYHPGFGESGDAASIDSIEDYVLHYMDLFDALGLDRFHLAGHSLGGWLAAEFAIRQPARIEKLVLVAPAGLLVPEAPAPGLFDIAPPDFPGYLTHDPTVAISYLPSQPDPVFDAALGRELGSFAKLIQGDPQGNPKLAPWIHRIMSPTLVLWGAEDRLRPTAQSAAWMKLLPNGQLELVPATGHLLFEETPSAGRFVTDFLEA